jgi:ferredoxin-NADP reductase
MSMPRKIRCTVERIIDHGGRVYTVDLAPAAPAPSFRPGQFLHLTVDDYDPAAFWPESRVFSIASSPNERRRLRICYSVKGRYTTRMEERLKVGSEVWTKLPYGDFVIEDAGDAVLIAGGTGISAFTAFVEALIPQPGRGVWLVYGARDPSLWLFRDLLLKQLANVPNFHLALFAETADGGWPKEMMALPRPPRCLTGRISLDQVWTEAAEPAGKVFYLSGPPIMLTTLGQQLQARGVPPERIRTDAWE